MTTNDTRNPLNYGDSATIKIAQTNSDDTQNLTEQWKAGKLKFGEYFCKTESNDYPEKLIYERYMSKVGFYQEAHGFSTTNQLVNDVVEVLAPVPSYEELQRLKDENKQMFDLLEMVARGITLDCDTEDVIRITSAVKKFCIAKRESERDKL